MSRMNPREVCANCRYFLGSLGRCQRNPPVVMSRYDGSAMWPETRWPNVTGDDYCGEFAAMMTTGRTEGGSYQPPDTKGWTENTIL